MSPPMCFPPLILAAQAVMMVRKPDTLIVLMTKLLRTKTLDLQKKKKPKETNPNNSRFKDVYRDISSLSVFLLRYA